MSLAPSPSRRPIISNDKQPAGYIPALWTPADAAAIQSCLAGTATPEQQKRAIEWIMYSAASMEEMEYRTNDREHAFVSGRRFVGLQIKKLSNVLVGAFTKKEEQR